AATVRALRRLAGWSRDAAPGRGVLAPGFAPPPAFALRHVDVRLPAGPRRAVYQLVVSARSRVVVPPRDAVLPLAAPQPAVSRQLVCARLRAAVLRRDAAVAAERPAGRRLVSALRHAAVLPPYEPRLRLHVPLQREVPAVLEQQAVVARLRAATPPEELVDSPAAVKVSAQRVRRAHHLVFRVPDLALQQVLFRLLMQGLPANTPCASVA